MRLYYQGELKFFKSMPAIAGVGKERNFGWLMGKTRPLSRLWERAPSEHGEQEGKDLSLYKGGADFKGAEVEQSWSEEAATPRNQRYWASSHFGVLFLFMHHSEGFNMGLLWGCRVTSFGSTSPTIGSCFMIVALWNCTLIWSRNI